MQEHQIGLVACAKNKVDNDLVCNAKNLYVSDLFKKASHYCRLYYDSWYILSAKYGLLHPYQLVARYDETLLDKSKEERTQWGRMVMKQITFFNLKSSIFFMHAGKAYCEPLTKHLTCRFPVEGLGIGEQLAWYKNSVLQFSKAHDRGKYKTYQATPADGVVYLINEEKDTYRYQGMPYTQYHYKITVTIDGQEHRIDERGEWGLSEDDANRDWGRRRREMSAPADIQGTKGVVG